MIIRLTSKLAKKLGIALVDNLPTAANPYHDWTARLFRVGRIQYILVTNTATLYSMVMVGKGVTTGPTLLAAIATNLEEVLEQEGIGHVFREFILPGMATAALSKNNNRSVTGSMTDLIYQVESLFFHRNLSLPEISRELNDIPMGYLKYGYPRDAFRSLVVESKMPHNEG